MSGDSILQLTRELCAFRTGVVAADNDAFFARVADEIPIALSRYASGSSFNGWVVPDLWRVRRAQILLGDEVVYDATDDPLGVAAYSRPFSGELTRDELLAHVITVPELPQERVWHCVWQYRPWAADWAFSIPHGAVERLDAPAYRVELETTFEPGEMLVAECEHRGTSDKTIVLNAHTCHPHMANDDMAGVAVLIRVFQRLAEHETHYTYRLVLGPEHLGTVFYLAAQTRETLDRFVCGAFSEMPGTDGAVKVASTFLGGHRVDAAFRNAARHATEAWEPAPWREGAGNDETVWEAPGYEVPFVEVSRAESFARPFVGYHTSLDTPDHLDGGKLEEFSAVFVRALAALEQDVVAYRLYDGLIALSNPRYDLYQERPDPAVAKDLDAGSERWGRLMDSVQRYFDGSITALEIAERHDLPFADVVAYLHRFEAKGLVRLERAELERVPISAPARMAPA